MKKKSNVLIAIVILILAIFGSIMFYTLYYLPNARISSNYVEFYQEYVADQFGSISINAINHDVIVTASEDNLIHVSFFQRIDNNNTYLEDGRSIIIEIIEEAVNTDSIFSGGNRHLKNITISLPVSLYYSLNNVTVSGSLSISDVLLKRLSASSITGNLEIIRSRIEATEVQSNSGNISFNSSNYDNLTASTITGNIMVELPLAMENYNVDLFTQYGQLVFNSSAVTVEDGDEHLTIREYQQSVQTTMKIKLSSLRGQIALNYPKN